MISLIMYLFPAGISLKIKENISKDKYELKDYVFNFVKYAFIINLIAFAVIFFYTIGNVAPFGLIDLVNNVGFVFKYFVLTAIISVVLPIVDEYLRRNVKINI